jgi:peptidoglycan/LPS O-acetylase OafA/YrhL
MAAACAWCTGALSAPLGRAAARLALGLAAVVLLAVLVLFGEGYDTPRPLAALFVYAWLARTVFGVGVAAFILAVLHMGGSLHGARGGSAAVAVAAAGSGVAAAVQRGWQRAGETVLGLRLWFVCAQLGYSAFLLHPIFIVLFYQVFPPASVQLNFGWFVLTAAINILCSHVLALVLYLLVEKPVMNLR